MQIPDDFPPSCQDIVEAELKQNRVYIQAANGDLWCVSIGWDDQPTVYLIARDERRIAALPNGER